MRVRSHLIRVVFCILFVMLAAASPTRAQVTTVRLVIWHSFRLEESAALDNWITGFVESASTATTRFEIEAVYMPVPDLLANFADVPVDMRAPDMVIAASDAVGTLTRIAAPLNSRIDDELRSQIGLFGTVTYNRQTFGIGVALESVVLYGNRTLITETPATLDDLLAYTAPQQEGLPPRYGFIFNKDFFWTSGIYSALGGYVDPANVPPLQTGDPLIRYLTIVQGFAGQEGLDVDTEPFKRREAAFVLDGTWAFREYAALLGEDLIIVPLPTIDGEPWSPYMRQWTLYFRVNSAELESAVEFARYVTSPDPQAQAAEIAGFVPVNGDAPLTDPRIAAMREGIIANAVFIPADPDMQRLWAVFSRTLTDVINGADVLEAAPRLENALNIALGNTR
jgi:arabinogalactan oligomer / maltooligosaccharide transport system substrate-binding protein